MSKLAMTARDLAFFLGDDPRGPGYVCDGAMSVLLDFIEAFPNGFVAETKEQAIAEAERVAHKFDWNCAAHRILYDPDARCDGYDAAWYERERALNALMKEHPKGSSEFRKKARPIYSEFERAKARIFAELWWEENNE